MSGRPGMQASRKSTTLHISTTLHSEATAAAKRAGQSLVAYAVQALRDRVDRDHMQALREDHTED